MSIAEVEQSPRGRNEAEEELENSLQRWLMLGPQGFSSLVPQVCFLKLNKATRPIFGFRAP